jgi:hypothetical protein
VPPASNRATGERPGKRRAQASVPLAQKFTFAFQKFLHTARIIFQLAITQGVARVGDRATLPRYGGSPNSAFEAGDPLLQYVVAYFSEDAPNGSTVAHALQPFFAPIDNISKEN